MTSASLAHPRLGHRAQRAQRYLTILAFSVIALGVFYRFSQLPTRTLFLDETATLMRVSGHTGHQMWTTLYDGQPRTAAELRAWSTVDGTSTIGKLVSSLEAEDAQHPPIFYLAELGIVSVFGNALVIWRMLPALVGVLSILAAYMLSREVFHDRMTSLIAAAVFAVSPIQRIYSEQAREYSLLTLASLVSTIALVRALRAHSRRRWALYAIIVAAGLYASPFVAYVVVAHAVMAILRPRPERGRAALGFCIAAGAAFVAYVPWIAQIWIHRADISDANAWSGSRWPISRLAAKWIFNVGSTFFDAEYLDLRLSVILAVVLIVAAVALVRAVRESDPEARWLFSCTIVVPALLLIAPDVLLGEHRSAVARYALPVYTFLALFVARGLVNRPLSATIILVAAFASSAVGATHASWWDNDSNADDAQIAAIVNSVPHAQVISTMVPYSLIAFSRVIAKDVPISLAVDITKARYTAGRPLFVVLPKQIDLRALETGERLTLEPVHFERARTAHDMGSQIGTGGTSDPDEGHGIVKARPRRFGQ